MEKSFLTHGTLSISRITTLEVHTPNYLFYVKKVCDIQTISFIHELKTVYI